MNEIKCNADTGNSVIYTGEKISSFEKYLKGRKTVVITDKNINRLYGNHFSNYPSVVIGTGEEIKSLATVEYIISELIKNGCDRKTFILGIGGGIVTDITGFASSVFMRGVDFGFVSSTLLSQVDASVGGKNGVNAGTLKNMIGVFRQPEFVICDPEMITTLSDSEYLSGLAEVIKHGFIRNSSLLSFISDNRNLILDKDTAVIEKMVFESVKIKTDVVTEDPKESGLRKILNFGHTFGHAVELINGIPHGHAVAFGMICALKLSHSLNYITEADKNYGINLLKNFGYKEDFNIEESDLFDCLSHDKKKSDDKIDFVLLNKIGNAFIEKIEIKELRRWYNDMCSGS
ncbi:MAG: 3-dehydroquinate synthase [Spirochaetes bacterium]|nr:3-dehydroquinate synthase [Spirochaetota bacterium]